MGVLGITCGVMVWAGIALLGLHLIIEKMAWLHTLIMVGGGLYLLDGLPDATWCALKKRLFLPLRHKSNWRKRAQFS